METTKAASPAVAWPTKEIHWVCHWALTASLLQVVRAGFSHSTMALPDLKLLTPGQAANVLAMHHKTLWFGVAGAGAAVLAMLLEGRARRIHRALACVALASAVAIHCVLACFVGVILVTAPTHDLLVGSVGAAAVLVFFASFDAKAAAILLSGPA